MRAIDADELLNPTDGLEHVKHCEEYGDVVLVCDIVYAPTIDVPERNVGKWIPVTERLPEESGKYLVCGGDKIWICDFMCLGITCGWYNDARNPRVKAWMNIPKPYRKETKC